MRSNKALIALSAAVALGVLGTASMALANDSSGENNLGGSVIPGSMVGVNPVFHPYWFGPQARKSYAAVPNHEHHDQAR